MYNPIIFIIDSNGNVVRQTGRVRAINGYRERVVVITTQPLDSACNMAIMTDNGNYNDYQQYLVPSSLKGKDLLETTDPLYQDYALSNVFMGDIEPKALKDISKFRTGVTSFSFQFQWIEASVKCTNYKGKFGIDLPLPSIDQSVGDYYECDDYNFLVVSGIHNYQFTKGMFIYWNGTRWVKDRLQPSLNVSSTQVAVEPSFATGYNVEDDDVNYLLSLGADIIFARNKIVSLEADVEDLQTGKADQIDVDLKNNLQDNLILGLQNGKVDKETGKSLVDDLEIAKLVGLDNQASLDGKINNKVDKVLGSSLVKDTEIAKLEALQSQETLNGRLGLKADLVGGTIPSNQLPSYVDDVIEVQTFAELPATGEQGKLYVVINDETQSGNDQSIYRWASTTYVLIHDEISANEIKTLYESNVDTNVFNDAEKTKLSDFGVASDYYKKVETYNKTEVYNKNETYDKTYIDALKDKNGWESELLGTLSNNGTIALSIINQYDEIQMYAKDTLGVIDNENVRPSLMQSGDSVYFFDDTQAFIMVDTVFWFYAPVGYTLQVVGLKYTDFTAEEVSTNEVGVTVQDKLDEIEQDLVDNKLLQFTVKNEVVNGDFTNGTTGWNAVYGSTISAINNILTVTGNGFNLSPRTATSVFSGHNSDRWYATASVQVTNSDCQLIELRSATGLYFDTITEPIANQWYKLSGIVQNTNGDNLHIGQTYVDSETASGKILNCKNVMAINLTATFGAGNEPTQEDMAILIEQSGGWFNDELGQKQMTNYLLGKIENKADIEEVYTKSEFMDKTKEIIDSKSMLIPATSLFAADGNPTLSLHGGVIVRLPYWVISGTTQQSITSFIPSFDGYGQGVEVKALLLTSVGTPTETSNEVWQVAVSQLPPGENINNSSRRSGAVIHKTSPLNVSDEVVLDSFVRINPSLPVSVVLTRLVDDVNDTWENISGIVALEVKPVNLPEPKQIQQADNYNAWPFVSHINDKLVCAYGKGTNHYDNTPSIFRKVSSDGGETWSPEVEIINTENTRDTITGKGKDSNGNILWWVRKGMPDGLDRTHHVYKSVDGDNFTLISSPTFSINPVHISDVISVPTVGLMSFYNDHADGSWGFVKSVDDGITWTQVEIENTLTTVDCPTEISGVYIDSGKILAIGRTEIYDTSTSYALFQMQSEDYGATWTKSKTNITDIIFSTPSLLYDQNTDVLSLYYFHREVGVLRLRKATVSEVWDKPLNWNSSKPIALGTTNGQDTGNVNAVEFGNTHVAVFYSGDESTAGIYASFVEQ